MTHIPKVESKDTIKTTISERRKAQIIKRCVINILKCWRMCKKREKTPKSANSV